MTLYRNRDIRDPKPAQNIVVSAVLFTGISAGAVVFLGSLIPDEIPPIIVGAGIFLMLVCFNVITQNCSEKITDRLMDKHDKELSEFAVLREKMNLSLKHKHAEKKPDNEKHYINIR